MDTGQIDRTSSGLNLSCESIAFQGRIFQCFGKCSLKVLISLARVSLFRVLMTQQRKPNKKSLNLSCESIAFQGDSLDVDKAIEIAS